MFENLWNRIITWFRDRSERNKLIQSFNESARLAFINGESPILLEALVSRGDAAYKHSFSRWLSSGFRIVVHTNLLLTSDEIKLLGRHILSNGLLVRHLIVLGWDTLEIHVENSFHGFKWNLSEYAGSIHLLG